MVRNPLCSGFLLCTLNALSVNLVLLLKYSAHSGPHPPNTVSPDPCSDFSSSSFYPSDHSPRPSTPSPLAATPDPVPQPPPYVPSSLPSSQVQASTTAAPNPPPQLVTEISSETSAPSSTPTSLGPLAEGPQGSPCPCPSPPFRGVTGAGVVRVHVPFSLTDLSQAKKHLGSFSSDPDNYLKEFKYLTQPYDLAWHGVYIILSPTLLPEEKEQVWQAAQAPAAEMLRTEDTKA